ATWTASLSPAPRGVQGAVGALMAPDGSRPLVVIDSGSLAIARDAACTAITARRLADPKAEVITMLGCNARGRAVLASLHEAWPNAARRLCFDPDVAAQAAFADDIMTSYDLASVIPPEPRECTEGAHILVSCLEPPLPRPVIERAWLQTGTLCVVLDADRT